MVTLVNRLYQKFLDEPAFALGVVVGGLEFVVTQLPADSSLRSVIHVVVAVLGGAVVRALVKPNYTLKETV